MGSIMYTSLDALFWKKIPFLFQTEKAHGKSGFLIRPRYHSTSKVKYSPKMSREWCGKRKRECPNGKLLPRRIAADRNILGGCREIGSPRPSANPSKTSPLTKSPVVVRFFGGLQVEGGNFSPGESGISGQPVGVQTCGPEQRADETIALLALTAERLLLSESSFVGRGCSWGVTFSRPLTAPP